MSKFSSYCAKGHDRLSFSSTTAHDDHMRQAHGKSRPTGRTRLVTPWKAPRRKAFEPAGVTLGANVVVLGLLGREHGWQVWSEGHGKGWWWLANGSRYLECHESDLTALGQCEEVTAPLFDELAS